MDRQIPQLITIIVSLFTRLIFASGAYEVLLFPQDARSLALHNATSAYDGPFLHNNPAAISMRSSGMTYSFLYLPSGIHSGEIHSISKTGPGIRASKISLLNYGTIIDSETEEKSYAFDVLVEVGYKKEVKNITSIGISGGYLFSSITGFYSQLLFSNIGVRSRLLGKRLGIGFSLENIGIHIKSYTDVKETIPALFRTSYYYKPIYIPLVISGDFVRQLDVNSFFISGGLEFILDSRLTLRLSGGSNGRSYLSNTFVSDFIAGISGGVGYRFTKMIVDVGFMNLGPAGFVVGFSLTKN